MNTHTPTIQDLSRKSIRELHAIFQLAAIGSEDTQRAAAERDTARQTVDNIRRVLAAYKPRP